MHKVGILTYNVMMSIPPPVRFNGLQSRKVHFARSLYDTLRPAVFDVVCLQELVFHTEHILRDLVHHPYHTRTVRSSLFGPKIRVWPSGLFIASRFPILREASYIFTGETYHVESVVAKGAVYACVHHPDVGYLHVVNTHLNAWTTDQAKRARFGQVRQLAQWVKSLSIPEQEPLVICGDWNIDFYEYRSDLLRYAEALGGHALFPHDVQFSIDGQNNSLVGLDAPDEYRTHKERLGCYENVLSEEVGVCTCCPRQLVDGFVFAQKPPRIKGEQVEVVRCKSPAKFLMHFNVCTTRFTDDVSDHYPVLFTCQLPQQSGGQALSGPRLVQDATWCAPVATTVTLIALLLFFCLAKLLPMRYLRPPGGF